VQCRTCAAGGRERLDAGELRGRPRRSCRGRLPSRLPIGGAVADALSKVSSSGGVCLCVFVDSGESQVQSPDLSQAAVPRVTLAHLHPCVTSSSSAWTVRTQKILLQPFGTDILNIAALARISGRNPLAARRQRSPSMMISLHSVQLLFVLLLCFS